MKKRILSILLAIIMVVSLLPGYAMAEGTTEIYVDTTNIGDLKAGDNVAIPIAIKNNPGICLAYLEFDIPDVLTYVSVEEKTGADNIVWTAPNKVQWEYDTDYSENYAEDGALFVLNFTVNEGAVANTYNFGVALLNGLAANLGDAEGDVTATFTPGSIKVVYEITGLSFVNGTQTGLTYDQVKAEAEKTAGAVTLTKPDSTNTYHFAGWFSGMTIEPDANGFYVIEPTENMVDIAGAEFRPRYDQPPTEGTYNALWIKGDASYVLAVNDADDNFDVYYAAADYNALTSAINGIVAGERVKLVKDMSTNYVTFNNSNTTDLWLDVNGCSVQSTSYYVLKMNSNTTAYNLKIDSGRANAVLTAKSSNSAIKNTGKTTVDFQDVTLTSGDQIQIYGGTIENCNITNNSTSYYALALNGGNVTISNSTIESKGKLFNVGAGTATLTRCTMNADNTAALFIGKNNSTPTDTLPPSGKVIFGAGNKITAANATTLFQNFAEVQFTSTDGTYQIASSGALDNGNVTTYTIPGSLTPSLSNGRLIFGTPYIVTYMSWDGKTSIYSESVVSGCNANLAGHTVDYGTEYAHVGWATEMNGSALDSYTVTDNVTLYAVRREKGISIGGIEQTTDTVEHHASYLVAEGLTISNAKKLADLVSLTYSGKTIEREVLGNTNYPILGHTQVYVTFKADALDSIAAKVTNEATITVVGQQPREGVDLGDALARVQLSVKEGSSVIDFTGAVEVMVQFAPEEGKNYRVYYIPDSGDPVGMPTTIVEGEDGNTYAKFTTTHFSTFEVRETTVANGYTAGLDITETEVRAGGNTVNVTVNVTHSDDTTFNAGEIEVSYDHNLLTPVTDNLPAGTFKVENGVLTIETYGDNKDMPYTYNLQFTTCASVDTNTTATITLTSAAFADKEDAVDSDLIRATIEPANDVVTILLETFEVTLPTDKDAEGPSEAVKSEDYTFAVDKDEHYDYVVEATMGGVAADVIDNGNDTYTIKNVDGEIIVTITKTAKQYGVTFDGEEPAASDGDKATHDTDYHFTLPTKAQWQYNYEITIAGTTYTGAANAENVVTIPGDAITGAIKVTITGEQTEFNLTLNGEDATVKNEDGTEKYDKGDSAIVTITPAEGYTYTVTAVKTGTEETVTVTDNGDNTYTIAGIQSDLTITVTKTLVGTVTITEYLTLDADNTDGTSSSMFLVVYEGTLADGYIPYCNDVAMCWSGNYNAYCYLVIDDTLAMAEENVTVSVKSGTKSEIHYTMNVNGSTKTDAADAQLVYDMYQAEYYDFNTVNALKFLLADTNNDKIVNLEDAAKIISEILNPTTAG